MDKIKHIKVETLKSRNFYADIFIPVMRRPGFKSGVETNVPVICTQQLGVSINGIKELRNIESTIQKIITQNIYYLTLNNKLEFKPSSKLIESTKTIFADVKLNSESIKFGIEKLLMNNSLMISKINQIQKKHLINATMYTIADFLELESNVNISKLINIIIKLIYWTESNIFKFLSNKPTNLDTQYVNPKLLYLGNISNQESYFILLMYYLGFDTLYFNFDKEYSSNWSKALTKNGQLINLLNSDKNNIWEEYFNQKSEIIKPKNEKNKLNNNNQQKNISNTNHQDNKEFDQKSNSYHKNIENPIIEKSINKNLLRKKFHSDIVIKPKKFNGDLNELLSPLSERAGYLSLPLPILPVYFIRYIGIDLDKNIYLNKIFNLDKKLSENFSSYIKFDTHIPIGIYTELNKKTSQIWKQFNSIDSTQVSELIEVLNGANLFDFIENELLRNQCYFSLNKILDLAFQTDSSTKIYNFKNVILKLVGWLSEHNALLFNNSNFDSKYNQKVLYYGDIKIHEALYLIFLFHLGIDIIYIHTISDDVFESLDSDLSISTVGVLDTVGPLEPFPKSEVLVQHQTTAYQASEEISKIVHNDQDGVYLPWQFEDYKTMPLTLKTTFDEFLILWKEEAKIRAGFRVENKIVYVPNLFVKISGTHESISEYWKFISALKDTKLIKLYSKLPFSKINYDIESLSALNFVFEKNNELSFEKLIKHRLYKYNHLSDSLQLQIFEKICLLINNNILTQKTDTNFRLKIVLTILNMDNDLSKLIQSFDYPGSIPKLIIFDPDKTTFSESDAIILSFLYVFGFDICVLTPTGYNNFEPFISEDYYSIFKLNKKHFELILPDLKKYSNSKSNKFWSNIFK